MWSSTFSGAMEDVNVGSGLTRSRLVVRRVLDWCRWKDNGKALNGGNIEELDEKQRFGRVAYVSWETLIFMSPSSTASSVQAQVGIPTRKKSRLGKLFRQDIVLAALAQTRPRLRPPLGPILDVACFMSLPNIVTFCDVLFASGGPRLLRTQKQKRTWLSFKRSPCQCLAIVIRRARSLALHIELDILPQTLAEISLRFRRFSYSVLYIFDRLSCSSYTWSIYCKAHEL